MVSTSDNDGRRGASRGGDPEGSSINELSRSPYTVPFGRGTTARIEPPTSITLNRPSLTPASNELNDVSLTETHQQHLVPTVSNNIISPATAVASRRTNDPDGSLQSLSSQERGITSPNLRNINIAFERTAHQFSEVLGQINADKTNADRDSLSRISSNNTPHSGHQIQPAASVISWKSLIGPDFMRSLLTHQSRNQIMENIELFVESTSNPGLIQTFAQEQIYGTDFDHKSNPAPAVYEAEVLGTKQSNWDESSRLSRDPEPSIQADPIPGLHDRGDDNSTSGDNSSVTSVTSQIIQSKPVPGKPILPKPTPMKPVVVPVTTTTLPPANPEVMAALRLAKSVLEKANKSNDETNANLRRKYDTDRIHKSKDTIPALPKALNNISFGYWYGDVQRILKSYPWSIDGSSIIDLSTSDDGEQKVRESYNYTVR